MEQELTSRAFRAYFRSGCNKAIPSWNVTESAKHPNGTVTITLRNVNGVLARYRHYPKADRLRRLPTKTEAW